MAITVTTLNSGGSTVNSTLYASGSYTPTSAVLVLFAVAGRSTAGGGSPSGGVTLEGNGATWVEITTGAGVTSTLVGVGGRLQLFRAMLSAPAAGATTIRIAGGGITPSAIAWAVAEFAGVSTASTDGAGAVVQTVETTASTAAAGATVSMAAFADSSNAAYGAFSHPTSNAWTTGGGFTGLSNVITAAAGEGLSLLTEFKSTADTSIDASGLTTQTKMAIGVEIAVLPAAPVADDFRIRRKMVGVGR